MKTIEYGKYNSLANQSMKQKKKHQKHLSTLAISGGKTALSFYVCLYCALIEILCLVLTGHGFFDLQLSLIQLPLNTFFKYMHSIGTKGVGCCISHVLCIVMLL